MISSSGALLVENCLRDGKVTLGFEQVVVHAGRLYTMSMITPIQYEWNRCEDSLPDDYKPADIRRPG